VLERLAGTRSRGRSWRMDAAGAVSRLGAASP